jgi:hypothetical protein
MLLAAARSPDASHGEAATASKTSTDITAGSRQRNALARHLASDNKRIFSDFAGRNLIRYG